MVAPRLRAPWLVYGFFAIVVVAVTAPARADWPNDAFANLPICTAGNDQVYPRSIPDGAGGVIIVWQDLRGGNWDVYAQRVSAQGVPMWTANGVPVCTNSSDQQLPVISRDGSGGAVIAWRDSRFGSTGIFVQRLNASGVAQWTGNGIALTTSTWIKDIPQIASDGAGGAVVVWQDYRAAVTADVYARRVNAAGTPLGAADGVAICTAANDQDEVRIVEDGSFGAVIAWRDSRGPSTDIYAQRVDGFLNTLWTPATGKPVCTAIYQQWEPSIAPDGNGSYLIAWMDIRNGSDWDVYGARFSASGIPQWSIDGVPISAATGHQMDPAVASDGLGGMIVAWRDYRSDANGDIYAQRENAAGYQVWTTDGVPLCQATGAQQGPAIIPDGARGAIVTWEDNREVGVNQDIYAQRVDRFGNVLWTADGVSACRAGASQFQPVIVSDGGNGAIIAWHDYRAAPSYDIYAQRMDGYGDLGRPEPNLVSVRDVPNDQGGKVKLVWSASYLDLPPYTFIDAYWILRSAPASVVAAARRAGAVVADDPAVEPQPGIRTFLVGPASTTDYAWEYLASQPAFHVSSYSYVAATTGDSVIASNPRTAFMVMARVADGSQWWFSFADSGYSVDNLGPAMPAPFAATYAAGSASLHWGMNSEADLAAYRLYRGTSASFVPGPGNLVTEQPDTGFVDVAGAPYFYKLSAVDIHGNESPYALAQPAGTTGTAGPGPRALAFAGPWPNPVRDGASFAFTLPSRGAVRITLFDANGRFVRTIADGPREAGEGSARWDGRDAAGHIAPSGLYFARLTFEGRMLVRRVAAVR